MKFFKNFLLIMVSISITLVLVEMALKVKNLNMKNYDIEMWKYSKELKKKSENILLGHEHLKSKCSTLQSVEICLNKNGLRQKNFKQNFPNRNILFLGSSITLGWGVKEEDTMTSLIQNYFDKYNKDNVQIINAGIGNYNTVRYIERYFSELQHLNPTDIVVHYFINDSEQLSSGNDNFILRNSQLAATAWMTYQKFIMSLKNVDLIEHYKNIYKDDNQGFTQMIKSLKRLSEYAKANNINLYLAMTPEIHFLEDYPFEEINLKMKTISEKMGYTFIDLYPSLKGLSFSKIQIMPGDAHPNEIGHRIMAKTIFEELNGI